MSTLTEANKLIYAFTGMSLEEYSEKLLIEYNNDVKEEERSEVKCS